MLILLRYVLGINLTLIAHYYGQLSNAYYVRL